MKHEAILLLLGILPALITATNNYEDDILVDPLHIDNELEIAHLYNNQWPTGIAVSSTGRLFSCFPAGLDQDNIYDGSNGAFQVAELTDNNTEVAYPSSELNSPPGGTIDYSQNPFVVKGLAQYLLGVNDLYIDRYDNLYVLDSGRAIDRNGYQALASSGGPKLVVIALNNDTVVSTFIFSEQVAPANSYLAAVTIDTINNFAFVADASREDRNGIVVLDLNSGIARRLLEGDPSVTAIYGFTPFVYGDSVYQTQIDPDGKPVRATFIAFGVTGIALTPNADALFISRLGGRYLYSVPTFVLRDPNATASEVAFYVRNYGEKGWGAGITVASDYKVYSGQAEQDGVSAYDSELGLVTLFTRDKRINFPYSFDIYDGYLYFTVNQLNYLPTAYPGQGDLIQDRRQKPYVLFRKKLQNGASKAEH